MRAVGGGEVSSNDVTQLGFDADGELQDALDDAYINLLEFAHDRDRRLKDPALDDAMRTGLQKCLTRIAAITNLTGADSVHDT